MSRFDRIRQRDLAFDLGTGLEDRSQTMVATVRMQPSGHKFVVEPGETLLESALRSGLSVRYRCNTGTCGECRAKLISGGTPETQAHDYVFSEQEKTDGVFLLCRTTASSDLTIQAVEARGTEDIPQQRITTSVCKLAALSDNIMELQLKTPRSKTLWFLAGQHVNLSVNGHSPSPRAIASCPCNGRRLDFHIGRRPGDPFSDYVFNELKMRQTVEVEGPAGRLVLDESAQRPLVFVAYGTGFAAIKSLIEHAISLDLKQAVRLYWMVGRPGAHYLENFCRSWREAIDDYVYVPMVSDPGPSLPGNELLSVDISSLPRAERDVLQACMKLVTDIPDLSGFDVYVGGVCQSLPHVRELLTRHGLPSDRLFTNDLECL
jgi:CDP-4-dehydro-6-deoxyglucose reductase